jgi:hypothetical protein
MTFDDWWKGQPELKSEKPKFVARGIWDVATAAEREACAAICDEIAKSYTLRATVGFDGTAAAEACAEEIRFYRT